MISSNHSLRFPQNDDRGAWMRRLVRFEFPNAFQGKKEVDFAGKLIAEEGDAIFSWAVCGRELMEQDLIEHGEVPISDTQKKRIQRIADQSCSVSKFVKESLIKDPSITEGVTTLKLYEEYCKFCSSNNVSNDLKSVFEKKLKTLLESTYKLRASNSVSDSSGKKVRGYRGVKIKEN